MQVLPVDDHRDLGDVRLGGTPVSLVPQLDDGVRLVVELALGIIVGPQVLALAHPNSVVQGLADLGLAFYTGKMFPAAYQNVAFIARRGSWNREQKFGYDVIVARTSGGKAKLEPFITGFLNEKDNSFSGRPTYVHQMKDGSLLVSDEQNGATYRITYDKAAGKTASR